jgi:hypothetical protein
MNTTNIDKLIAEKSKQQSESEWNALIFLLFEFFKMNPAGKCDDGPFTGSYNTLQSKSSGYFDNKNKVAFDDFEKSLMKFGAAWREERKCRHIEIKTKELLEKVSLI